MHVLPPAHFKVGTSESVLKRGISTLKNEVSDTTTISGGAKVVRGFAQIISPFVSALKRVVPPLSFLVDVIKFLDGIKRIDDIRTQASRKIAKNDQAKHAKRAEQVLKTASAVTGLGLAALAGVKLLDALGFIKLAKFTETLGRIPVIGFAFPLFPFSSFIAAADILKCTLEIGASGAKLHGIRKEMGRVNDKQDDWKTGDITSKTFTKYKSKHAKTKIDEIKKQIDLIGRSVIETGKKVTLCSEAYQKHQAERARKKEEAKYRNLFVRTFKKIGFFFSGLLPNKETRELGKACRIHDASWRQFKSLEERNGKLAEKKELWKKMKHLDEPQQKANKLEIQAFQKAKLNKWHTRIVDLRWDVVKESLSLFLNTAVIVASIAAIVLTATGIIGLLPAALSVTGAFLFISAMGLGLYLFKKYKTHERTSSVPMPRLQAAQAA
jgi:hypothetical protein